MTPTDENTTFPIVGIGASAGGLEAFTLLLSNLRPDTGMAFVLVQHLDPTHESRLTDLLQRSTSMTVKEAEHGERVEPNHVYVIPPNAQLALVSGELQVSPRGDRRGPHLPIDLFFHSMSEAQSSRAIAVVLSGTGSDGTQGLCAIKAVGGITFGITVLVAIAAMSARETYRIHMNDLGKKDAVPVPKEEYDRLREQSISGAQLAKA